MSVLASFQGSVSCRYLLPALAMSMAILSASRKWKVAIASSSAFFRRSISSQRSRSTSAASVVAGTTPPKYLCVRTMARFTKLPRMATSSLLLRAWKSDQVKSLSLVSGALAVSTYRSTSCLPGKSLRYSWSHTAQLREVEILSPSRLRNSLAGTFSGSWKLSP